MEELFIKLLNMSINAGWLVLAIIALRFIFKKAPKKFRVLLWALVGLRLICPFSFESVMSLIPSAETVPQEIISSNAPAIHSGIPALNTVINPVISEGLAPDAGDSANPMQIIVFVATLIWLAGIAAMLIYALISYIMLRLKTKETVLLTDNVFIGDKIATPFILGVFRPRIYLPSGMAQGDSEYVITHEKYHIKRRDHLWKPLGFLILSVYWFNPILWLAYVLLCKDIELACDEKVIEELGTENKKAYAETLINCSVQRRLISACPVAFGETDVKNRIKSILSYKKPALWIIIISLLISGAVAVCFATDPKTEILGNTFEGELIYTPVAFSSPTVMMYTTTITHSGEIIKWDSEFIHRCGTLRKSDFNEEALYRGIINEDEKENIKIGKIIQAYEAEVSEVYYPERLRVYFTTDENEIYAVTTDKDGKIIFLFRLFETSEKTYQSDLDKAVNQAITENNKGRYYISHPAENGEEKLAVSAHHTLKKEETNNTVTVYGYMRYEEYERLTDGSISKKASSSGAIKLAFRITGNGRYKLISYAQPTREEMFADMQAYEPFFASSISEDYASNELSFECYEKAAALFGGDFGYSEADSENLKFGSDDQYILLGKDVATGSYDEPYEIGDTVRVRHSYVNTSATPEAEKNLMYDYNLTVEEVLSGDEAKALLKENCSNYEEEEYMLREYDLYLAKVKIRYNKESDITHQVPIDAFITTVNELNNLLIIDTRFNISSFSSETVNGENSNWYPVLVPKGENVRLAYVIGSMHEYPGPVATVCFDIDKTA